jgi:hypothetical protein
MTSRTELLHRRLEENATGYPNRAALMCNRERLSDASLVQPILVSQTYCDGSNSEASNGKVDRSAVLDELNSRRIQDRELVQL